MEIVLFILLVGVWAAFVLPSFLSRRRDKAVNRQSGVVDPFLATPTDLHRRQVLSRRRLALVRLMVAAVGRPGWAGLSGPPWLRGRAAPPGRVVPRLANSIPLASSRQAGDGRGPDGRGWGPAAGGRDRHGRPP